MSKAFTKEDDDLPERSVRARSSSGLPPGARNYLTADGERRLRQELETLLLPHGSRPVAGAKGRIAELQHILTTATIVPGSAEAPDEVLFGTRVTVQRFGGERACYRIVGVDETKFDPSWVSWISPRARALIGKRAGERVTIVESGVEEVVEILQIE